ncbi:MAG: coniferyl-alcohol dehydrogenase [Rhizobiaceae bacterium]
MKVALTGGATGIGASVAARLKEQGATVIAFDVNEPMENVDRWIQVDLGDPTSISDVVRSADSGFDALINNAGLPPREGMSEVILRVNYFGLKHFMTAMLDKLQPGASIVNIASKAGAMWRDNIEEVKALMALKGTTDLSDFVGRNGIDPVRAYNLSKEAVIALTMAETERLLRRDIRVNSVSPAAVSTGILDDFKKAFGDRAAQAIARAGRPGTSQEIAEVIVFLANPQSGWIKGQDITIDGGMTAMVMTDAFGLN